MDLPLRLVKDETRLPSAPSRARSQTSACSDSSLYITSTYKYFEFEFSNKSMILFEFQ
jgi:hypothetical protein